MISLDIKKRLGDGEKAFELKLKLNIAQGEFLTLYGPSGAGKTSTLRLLSGLMKPDTGSIDIDGKTWVDTSRNFHIASSQRKIGYVFQDYALFPHMTVLQNLEYALNEKKDENFLKSILEMVELGEFHNRKPAELSGGQQQRVALARALAQKPNILLLDEPLASLDNKLRVRLQEYLMRIHRELKLTTILVSHDLNEITRLSNRVIILDKGSIVKMGAPSEVFVTQNISGKFKFFGEILDIAKEDILFVITVLIHNQMVKVIAQEEEVSNLNIGDRVLVASKAFNPVIYKIDV